MSRDPAPLFADTIYALASAGGRAGVAVIRVSGPQSRFAIETLSGPVPQARKASYRRLHARNGESLDQALVLWFPGPGSFTGEDCAEFHVHGSRAVIAAVLAELGAIKGCRLAEAGEFSRRAFLNGRMDLAQAEGLADLIDAETEAQRRQALYQLDGALGRQCALWRAELIRLQAQIEAEIDFSDEGDVGHFDHRGFLDSVVKLKGELQATIGGFAAAQRVRDGLRIVITGAPNAGKSSLLNALARRDVALVSQVAGTTRDLIEVSVNFFGELVTFVDTAGIRESADLVEQMGIERALTAIDQADLVIELSETAHFSALQHDQVPRLRVLSKCDLAVPEGGFDLALSAQTGAGLDALFSWLRQQIDSLPKGSGLITQQRHRQALLGGLEALDRIIQMHGRGSLELMAEDLRLCGQALAVLVGAVGVEDVLDRLFSNFCIGK